VLNWPTFLRRYVAPYTGWYLGGIASLVATNWLATSIPLDVADAIDALSTSDADSVPWKAAWIALMGVIVIGVRTASRVLFFTPGRLIEAKLKHDFFERMLSQQPIFLRHYPAGDLVSRATSDINYLRLLWGFGVLQLINTTVAVAFAGVQMVRISPMLALLTTLPVVFALLVNQWFIRVMFVLIHRMQQETAAISDQVLSSYQGLATVQAFNAYPEFLRQFDERNNAYRASSLQRSRLRSVLGPILGLAASISIFMLLWQGGPLAASGQFTAGQFVAYLSLLGMLIGPLRATSFLVSVVKQAQVGMERLGEVMGPEPERPDHGYRLPAPTQPPEIVLRSLTFAYPDAPETPVLRDISLTLKPGQTLGILGPTGSGKSALLKVISRLYNPPEGDVLVDGKEIRHIDLDDWRRAISMVPQRTFLFSASLKDNILLGAPDDGRLERMLSLTTLDVDVQSLPDGVLSPVGESGIMLSGGQRQRAALARGLLKPHHLLLLDDVLSAVDHTTEVRLIQALRQQKVTTVIVAHRISAIQHADTILVLEDGRATAIGTHEELCQKSGFYRDTWQHQLEQAS